MTKFPAKRALLAPLIAYVALGLLSPGSAQAQGQNRPNPEPSQGTQLIMLGTGGGPNLRKDRSESATLLIVDDARYLIDCGLGTLRRMTEVGIPPASVRTVFITHNHPDHNLDLAGFMGKAAFSLQGGGRGQATYEIFGPAGTREMVDAAARYVSVGLNIFAAEGLGHPIPMAEHFLAHDLTDEGLVYEDEKIRVTAAENTHYTVLDEEYRPDSKSFAYRIETPHGVIVFTGDTGYSEKLEAHAKDADVLVSEIMNGEAATRMIQGAAVAMRWPEEQTENMRFHMTETHLLPEEIAEMASSAGVRSVLLNHFGPGGDNDDDEVQADLTGIRAGYSGQVVASRDRDRYCVNAAGSEGPALSECD